MYDDCMVRGGPPCVAHAHMYVLPSVLTLKSFAYVAAGASVQSFPDLLVRVRRHKSISVR